MGKAFANGLLLLIGAMLFLAEPSARSQPPAKEVKPEPSIEPKVEAKPQPAKPLPDKAAGMFGLDKLWTMHIAVSAKDWDAMQPKGGPGLFGFPGQPKAKEGDAPKKEGDTPKKEGDAPKKDGQPPKKEGGGAGNFGYEYTYVKGTIDIEGKTLADVGVRFKGNSSYMTSARGLKRPFKIDFNRFIEDQKFLGMQQINLANNAMDPSQLREALAYEQFRAAGIPAPRTAFVKLYLTVEGKHQREFLGLYTMIEEVDSRFLKDHFGSNKGMLLKPERAQGFPYLGEDWKGYETKYRPKKEPTDDQKKRLVAFTKLVHESTDEAFRKGLPELMEVDEFLRFLAVNGAIANLDSFLGTGHNYYLYLHPKTNKFVWIPWDLNLSFAGFSMGIAADSQANLSIRQPYMGRNRLIERVLADKEWNAAYRKHLETMVAGSLVPETMHAAIDAAGKVVSDAVAEEAKKAKPFAFPFGVGGMFAKATELKPFVTKRVESISSQLAGKSEGVVPSGRFGPGGGPAAMMAPAMVKAGDTDGDKGISLDEAKAGVKRFFEECDKEKNGAVDEKTLADVLDRVLPKPPGFGGGAPNPMGNPFGPGKQIAGAIFRTAEVKDKKVTLESLQALAEKLHKEWDKSGKGILEEKPLVDGLSRWLGPPQGLRPPMPPEPGPAPKKDAAP